MRLARAATLRAALAAMGANGGTDRVAVVRHWYELQLRRTEAPLAGAASGGVESWPNDETEIWGPADEDVVRAAMLAERQRLSALRTEGVIGDAAFQAVEQELDWAELNLQQLLQQSTQES